VRTVEQRIYDGDQARLVLENEAFAAAFADIKQEYTEAWKQSPARDSEGREKLYLMIKLSEKLEATLRAAMEDGRIAADHLRHLQSKQSMLTKAKDAIGWES